MGLADAFNVALHVPALREAEVATVLKALDAFAPDEVRARGARARPSARPSGVRRGGRRLVPCLAQHGTPLRMPGRAFGLAGPHVSRAARRRAPIRPSAEGCTCRRMVRPPASTPACGRRRAARRQARPARKRLARHGSRPRREAAGRARAQAGAAVAGLADAQVPIKRLLLLLDLARQGVPAGAHIPLARWHQVLADLSLN